VRSATTLFGPRTALNASGGSQHPLRPSYFLSSRANRRPGRKVGEGGGENEQRSTGWDNLMSGIQTGGERSKSGKAVNLFFLLFRDSQKKLRLVRGNCGGRRGGQRTCVEDSSPGGRDATLGPDRSECHGEMKSEEQRTNGK